MVVKIENLVKRYGDLVAVDHFNLEIEEGEIFGLLGPNGSGKSTTIHCLLSLLTYDKGHIEIFGKEMTPTGYDIKKDIGIIMLACQMSDFRSPAKGGTNALMFVECHVDAVSATADGNSRITFACLDSLCQLVGEVGIIATLGGVGSVIFVRPAFYFQPTANVLFQFESGVVGTKSNSFHIKIK